jgi:ribosomal protein L34
MILRRKRQTGYRIAAAPEKSRPIPEIAPDSPEEETKQKRSHGFTDLSV